MTAARPTGRQFTITHGAASATVVEVGGGLRTFAVGGREVVDGYDADAMADSGRGQVLIPWPNRLDHGSYVWDGHDLQVPINEIERSNAIHGLVRFAGWSCVDSAENHVELAHTSWPSPGYPFTLDISIVYEIDDSGLAVTTTTRNAGSATAPYGAGQHPYVFPPDGIAVDDCSLVVPATKYLETDDRGLPTRVRPVDDSPFDFRASERIGALELDTAFTDLGRDADGKAHVTVTGDGRSVALWMDEGYRYVQIFTGDTVPGPRRRRSLAIEPMTCPPNALATGVDVIALAPDETITTSWGLEVVGA